MADFLDSITGRIKDVLGTTTPKTAKVAGSIPTTIEGMEKALGLIEKHGKYINVVVLQNLDQNQERILFNLVEELLKDRESKSSIYFGKIDQLMNALNAMKASGNKPASGKYFELRYQTTKILDEVVRTNVMGRKPNEKLLLDAIAEGDRLIATVPQGKIEGSAANFLARKAQALNLLAFKSADSKKKADYKKQSDLAALEASRMVPGYGKWMKEVMNANVENKKWQIGFINSYDSMAFVSDTVYGYKVQYPDTNSIVSVTNNTINSSKTISTYAALARVQWEPTDWLRVGLTGGGVNTTVSETVTKTENALYQDGKQALGPAGIKTYSSSYNYWAPKLGADFAITPWRKLDWNILTLNSFLLSGGYEFQRTLDKPGPQYNFSVADDMLWTSHHTIKGGLQMDLSPRTLEDTISFLFDANAYCKMSEYPGLATTKLYKQKDINGVEQTYAQDVWVPQPYSLPSYGVNVGLVGDLNLKYFYFGAGYQFSWRYDSGLAGYDLATRTATFSEPTIIEHKFPLRLGVNIPLPHEWNIRLGIDGVLKVPGKTPVKSVYDNVFDSVGGSLSVTAPFGGSLFLNGGIRNSFAPNQNSAPTADGSTSATTTTPTGYQPYIQGGLFFRF